MRLYEKGMRPAVSRAAPFYGDTMGHFLTFLLNDAERYARGRVAVMYSRLITFSLAVSLSTEIIGSKCAAGQAGPLAS
jgi:hypothetical protein